MIVGPSSGLYGRDTTVFQVEEVQGSKRLGVVSVQAPRRLLEAADRGCATLVGGNNSGGITLFSARGIVDRGRNVELDVRGNFHGRIAAIAYRVCQLEGGKVALLQGAVQDGILALAVAVILIIWAATVGIDVVAKIVDVSVVLDVNLLTEPASVAPIANIVVLEGHADAEVEVASCRALEFDRFELGVVFEGKATVVSTGRFPLRCCRGGDMNDAHGFFFLLTYASIITRGRRRCRWEGTVARGWRCCRVERRFGAGMA